MTESASPIDAPTVPPTPSIDPAEPLVAKAGRYYRNARYIMTAGILFMGGFFLYDGYVRYPAQNREIAAVAEEIDRTPQSSPKWVELDQMRTKLGSPHNDTSIATQKALGYGLPILAVVYFAFFMNKSRGTIRLQNDTLHAPGHPPVPLADITAVDDSLWKKKGIAKLRYDTAGTRGTITLDDFVYEQTPVDAMYERIQSRAKPATS